MPNSRYALILAIACAAGFVGGVWVKSRPARTDPPAAAARRILFYRCPMHPQYTSDRPGEAGCCGMRLEPVYEGSAPAAPAGAIAVSPEKQQLMGVRVAPVEHAGFNHAFRTSGRVAVDETAVYRVRAAIDGWIREAGPNPPGTLVQKGERLASFYSPEFLSAQQAYLYALGALDRFQAAGRVTPEQTALTKTNIQQAADSLRNLGMGDPQIEEIGRDRKITQLIHVYAPISGFVLARSLSPGERFEKGTELYRIADLSRVWVLADLFENEARLFHSGASARVRYQAHSYAARSSGTLPQFDAASRTLKVRFIVDNPDLTLRQDMFVDIEFSVRMPLAVTVPSEAVLDSGVRKTVFVDLGNGYFEPRDVETGWRLGDRVQITRGLKPGDRIAVSGNFFLDSEARLKNVAPPMPSTAGAATVKDPVCGMEVEPGAAALQSEYRAKRYYFCSPECKKKFDADPQRYTGAPSVPSRVPLADARGSEEPILSRDREGAVVSNYVGQDTRTRAAGHGAAHT